MKAFSRKFESRGSWTSRDNHIDLAHASPLQHTMKILKYFQLWMFKQRLQTPSLITFAREIFRSMSMHYMCNISKRKKKTKQQAWQEYSIL